MKSNELKYYSEPIPGIFSVSSNVPVIPGYPLISRLLPLNIAKTSQSKCSLNLNYIVSDRASSGTSLRGKTFESVNADGMRQETPIGKFGRLSVLLQWHDQSPTLYVNKTYHRLAKITIGNVHSSGWLNRDLTNAVLLQNSYALLHAAAIQHKDKVIIIFGLSNTGKTRAVFSLVEKFGVNFYGDDLVLTDGSNVYSCPFTAANIDPDKSRNVSYKISQHLRRGMPFYENIAGTPSFSIADALGHENIAKPAKVTDVIIMRKSDTESLKTIDQARASALLLASNRTEFTYSASPVLFASEFFETGIKVNEMISAEGRILKQLSGQANCHCAQGDYRYLQTILENILSLPES